MDELTGRAEPSINDALSWNTRVEPPEIGGGPWVPPVGDDLLSKLAGVEGVPGSLIPTSESSATKVEAETLIGDPAAGKRNAWVYECLEVSDAVADRLNAVAALVWMGYGAWTNYEQDQANVHWADARARLKMGEFARHADVAARIAQILQNLPE